MTTLYHTQATPPAPLPFRIRLSDGRTRTNPATFTPEEIADAGYIASPAKPDHDPETQRVIWQPELQDWVIEPLPYPTPADVNAERDRRLSADFSFAGKQYQRDAVSVQRITGAATLAGFAMGAGAQPGNLRWHGGSTDFAWIASDNTLVAMDAQTAFAFGQTCANVETRLIFAAKALREMDPIPRDYQADTYWP